jgi:hypothetical protein
VFIGEELMTVSKADLHSHSFYSNCGTARLFPSVDFNVKA